MIPSQALAATEPVKTDPIPVLAYYYIWFDPTSWDRAKTDYPLLGRYSSDDRAVMQQHIRWAKQAGIDGFIVSWKSTPTLNRRLEQLVELAETENFKLLIIYQGLDFEREPIPVEKVASDLDYFVYRWGNHPAFDLFGRPVVIWSGTWEFSVEEIASVTERFRDRIYILASERNLEGYQRVNHLVDGNAYYWSSVDPETYPGYAEKLQEMGKAVHADGGLWIAPAAPGVDARLSGGTRGVGRQDGGTAERLERVQREQPHRAQREVRRALPGGARADPWAACPGCRHLRLGRPCGHRRRLRAPDDRGDDPTDDREPRRHRLERGIPAQAAG